MVSLADLWLPILLSTAFVFIVSSILHMVIPIHKGDFKKLPGEKDVLEVMRNQGVQPGQYSFPFPPSMKEVGSPEMTEKYKQGPVGIVTIMPSAPPAMGKSLVQWFIHSLVISVLVAYVARLGLERGTDYMVVFRVTSTAAILGYSIGHIHESVWKGQSWGTTFRFIFDGIIYGLVTAGTFGWLWPDVM